MFATDRDRNNRDSLIRRRRELKSEFVADRNRSHRNSPPAVAPRVGFYSRSRSMFTNVPFVGARVQFMTITIPSSREKCTAHERHYKQSYRVTGLQTNTAHYC